MLPMAHQSAHASAHGNWPLSGASPGAQKTSFTTQNKQNFKFATNCGGVSVTMQCMQVLAEKMQPLQPEAALASGGHWGTRQGPCCHGLVIFIFFCKNCLPPCGPKNGFKMSFFVIWKARKVFWGRKHPPKSQNVSHYHPQPLEKSPHPIWWIMKLPPCPRHAHNGPNLSQKQPKTAKNS